MKKLTQSEFGASIESGVVIIDFFATRCGPCKMISPYLDQMQEKLWTTATFYKVDVDEERELASTQNITAMPTLKIFKDGQEIKTIVWADLEGLWNGIQAAL